jgi:hypothetical protein
VEAGPYSGQNNPYQTVPPPPPVSVSYPLVPPTPASRKKSRVGLIGGIILLVLLILGGVFVYQNLTKTAKVATTSTTPTNSSTVLSPDAAQKLYTHVTSGTPVLNDPLASNGNFGWDHSADQSQNTSCVFIGGNYHSKAQPTYFSPCYANATNYSNFAFQARMTILSGHSGGLLFRADGKNDDGYYFRMSTDGTCLLKKLTNAGQQYQNLVSITSPAVHKGANQPNLLAVIAQGNTISLFVNKQYIGGFSDNAYQSGEIGLYVDSDGGAVEGSFSNAQVWQL